ncbi:MAG: cbb3-type cytochrome c oxidase N-terminal domain-containing protein, partial [Verrucomicrobiota bacterium]
MSENHEPLLLDHEADGIKEFDNVLPRWWLWLFYITIIFSVGYMLYFHVLGIGLSPAERYALEMEQAKALYGSKGGETIPDDPVVAGTNEAAAAEVPEEAAYALKTDQASLDGGKTVYTQYCFPCHQEGGRGLVGPNFTDDYFIHGPTYADSVRIILNGVPAKGMISWRPVLSKEQLENVASYIYS